jgi:hypothetical protein
MTFGKFAESVHAFVRTRETTRELLDGFLWNLIWDNFTKTVKYFHFYLGQTIFTILHEDLHASQQLSKAQHSKYLSERKNNSKKICRGMEIPISLCRMHFLHTAYGFREN